MPTNRGVRYNVSAKDFIQIWQTSENLEEVIKKTGTPKGACNARFYNYRKHGIPLKKLRSSRNLKWAELKQLAEKIDKES